MHKGKILIKKQNGLDFILETRQAIQRINKITYITIAFWSIIVVTSLYWNISSENNKAEQLAKVEATANLNKDRAFRLWASGKGGLYIVRDPSTHPNPFLSHIPNRDIASTNGLRLTLINPATIIREVGEQHDRLYGIKAKITGKVYLNPLNKPDAWEIAALEKFSKNRTLKEISQKTEINKEPFLRLIRPMYMEPSCMKCHAITGIKVGELRGATTVAIPLTPYFNIQNEIIGNLVKSYIFFWFCGIALILFFSSRNKHYERHRIS